MERIEAFVVELCRRGRDGFAKFNPDPVLVIQLPEGEVTEFDAVTDTSATSKELQDLIARFEGAGAALAAIDDLRVKRLLPAAGPIFTIGRTLDNYVPLPATSVSKRHATIEVDGDRVQVVDAGSKNGIEVAGMHLSSGQAMDLVAGVTLRFGEVVATFHSAATFCDLLETVFPWAKS